MQNIGSKHKICPITKYNVGLAPKNTENVKKKTFLKNNVLYIDYK